MSRTIYKFPFDLRAAPITDTHALMLDENHKVVLVALDPSSGQPAIWIEHDPFAMRQQSVRYFIVGTGHDIPEGASHAGSVVHGTFVWHVYRSHII